MTNHLTIWDMVDVHENWHIDNASWLEGREPDTELLWARYGTVAIVQNGRPVFTVLERELLPVGGGLRWPVGSPVIRGEFLFTVHDATSSISSRIRNI